MSKAFKNAAMILVEEITKHLPNMKESTRTKVRTMLEVVDNEFCLSPTATIASELADRLQAEDKHDYMISLKHASRDHNHWVLRIIVASPLDGEPQQTSTRHIAATEPFHENFLNLVVCAAFRSLVDSPPSLQDAEDCAKCGRVISPGHTCGTCCNTKQPKSWDNFWQWLTSWFSVFVVV